jgi:hypothetical protein
MLNKCDSRLKEHSPHNKVTNYGGDISGKKVYEFNSLGFRSEEYNPNAEKLIYVGGCSYTFGVGLNIEESWPYIFKELLAKKEDKTSDSINLLNFSAGGHSNDYIVRTLISQANKIKPDLIIAYFTGYNRAEYVNEDGHYNIRAVDGFSQFGNKEFSQDYLIYYTHEIGFINTLKNMLLLQYFCESKGIDYIFGVMGLQKFSDKNLTSNKVCKEFLDLINKKHLCNFTLRCLDRAADRKRNFIGMTSRGHPGPRSNKIFAKELLRFYEQKKV